MMDWFRTNYFTHKYTPKFDFLYFMIFFSSFPRNLHPSQIFLSQFPIVYIRKIFLCTHIGFVNNNYDEDSSSRKSELVLEFSYISLFFSEFSFARQIDFYPSIRFKTFVHHISAILGD